MTIANIIPILLWFVFTSPLLILSPALPARAAKLLPEWRAQSEPAHKILSAARGNWLPSVGECLKKPTYTSPNPTVWYIEV